MTMAESSPEVGALAASLVAGRNNPNFRDDGRMEITGRDSDAFTFRTMTLPCGSST